MKTKESDSTPAAFFRIFYLLLAIAIIVIVWFFWWRAESAEKLDETAILSSAQSEITHQNPGQALELLKPLLEREKTPAKAWKLAGEAALQMEEISLSITYFSEIRLDGSAESIQSNLRAAELAFTHGYASRAESILRQIVEHDSAQVTAHGMLAFLLMLEGRHFEALPSLQAPLRLGFTPIEHLFFLESDRLCRTPACRHKLRKRNQKTSSRKLTSPEPCSTSRNRSLQSIYSNR